MLTPSGTILFDVPLADDDIDKSLEFPSPPPDVSDRSAANVAVTNTDSAETHAEVENALGKLSSTDNAATLPQNWVIESEVLINRKMKSKAKAVADFGKYRKCAGSTDHLWQVQDIE